jgi:hypothetical protein
MNRGLSYALTLRAIGQSLEAQQTKDFDLSALETGFIVRENERRSLKWRRTIRSNGIGEMLDLSDVHYSVDDIAILDQSGKERRRTTAQTPNFYLFVADPADRGRLRRPQGSTAAGAQPPRCETDLAARTAGRP